MLQKELAKRLRARYDTKMDGNEWLEVSSDGIPLCRIKYNGQFLSNADQNLSDEYRSKIADIQDEISTVREYVGLYEHAPQMKADGVSDYRQLAAFGDTVLAATYSEKNGFIVHQHVYNKTDLLLIRHKIHNIIRFDFKCSANRANNICSDIFIVCQLIHLVMGYAGGYLQILLFHISIDEDVPQFFVAYCHIHSPF